MNTQVNKYRKYRELSKHMYKNVIIIDEGIIDGRTMSVAIDAIYKMLSPKYLVVAIPIGIEHEIAKIRRIVDDCIVLIEPTHLKSLKGWYTHLPNVSENEDINLLSKTHSQVYEV